MRKIYLIFQINKNGTKTALLKKRNDRNLGRPSFIQWKPKAANCRKHRRSMEQNLPNGDEYQETITQIIGFLKNIRFGSLEIVVHEGRIVQIDKRERFRFNQGKKPNESNQEKSQQDQYILWYIYCEN